jgi:saccharopine dehydrogenase-like NADP-dependent oxidoreductase
MRRHSPIKRILDMYQVLVLGAGKIGSLIATLLVNAKDYKVYLGDIAVDTKPLQWLKQHLAENQQNFQLVKLDAKDPAAIIAFLKQHPVSTLISSLPYYCNIAIAKIAHELGLNYFDLTEDTFTTGVVTELAAQTKAAFVPQCGLAPGFISIVANSLMQNLDQLDTVKLRVGALPANASNPLQYSLTWSTEGLINEYGNPCQAIHQGNNVSRMPLEDLEEITIDGLSYEAFNTSGGIGSLPQTYFGRVNQLTYKTIRYPGHCAKIKFLMNDLKLNQDRDTLRRILENVLPKTYQDVVVVYVSVSGMRDGQFCEMNYVKKLYPLKINGVLWSAIQLTTASALSAIVDMILTSNTKYSGLIKQEDFSLAEFTANRFGQYYL